MDKKIIFASILLTLLFVGSAGMNILQANQSKEWHVQQERYEKQLSDKDSELKDTSERLSNIEKRYQKLYKEKNGATNERISRITKKIFTALYTYDTKNQTVQDRKEKLKGYMSEGALEQVFQNTEGGDEQTAETISKLIRDPIIYVQSADSDQLLILAEVHFEFSVAGSDKMQGHYLYQMTYDQFNDTIIGFKPLSDLPTT